MNSAAKTFDPGCCPLCGRPNDCQLCTAAAYKGPCWCRQVEIPEALLSQIPPEARGKACLCRDCVTAFHRGRPTAPSRPELRPGDFYFVAGLMVFTGQYHLRRGYCCGNGCRHCPYSKALPRTVLAAGVARRNESSASLPRQRTGSGGLMRGSRWPESPA